ncbi:hypothetical protein [Amycolatopsis suaedae]|uniref:LppX_LprAFG lipoprotein n=1 Tax=Amycolatopsis suaedae TaxID=2510978 RepID=A0A4Q7J1V2_9PSEU|nr:hypothetical protein [Amycolatopsis suaedae]RZQ60718.1 hypothetical protein EWH70_26755 [Amycolatopsis suaedae]
MRKTAAAVAGLALALVLGACGDKPADNGAAPAPGDSGGLNALFGDAQELVRAASFKADTAKTAKFTMEMTAEGQNVTAKGEGRFDGPNTAMSMTMSMPGAPDAMEMRTIGTDVYMKMPEGQGAALGTDKPWIKLSLGGDDPISKTFGAIMTKSTEQSDPRRSLEMIQKAGKITKSEQTQLDGQPADHYWVDLDLVKMVDMMLEGMPAEVAGKAKESMQGKSVVIPMELWLNAEKLPVQVTMDMGAVSQAIAESGGAPASAPGNAAEGKVTMKYTDWGAPVTVEAPPADQVGEIKIPK